MRVSKTSVGWLALSAPESAIRIGTVGASRAKAEENFVAEIRAWAAIADRPD